MTLTNHFLIRFYFEEPFYDTRVGALQIDDLRLTTRAQVTAVFPLQDSFEGQAFNQGLYPQSAGRGVTEINSDNPYSGTYNVLVGQKIAGDAGAWLDLLVDLSGQTDVFLDFWWRATGDGTASANGIYISDNYGANWTKIRDMNGNPQAYTHAIINLANAAIAQGLTLNNHFLIRFYFEEPFYDTRVGALRIDNLRLGDKNPAVIDQKFVYLPLVKK